MSNTIRADDEVEEVDLMKDIKEVDILLSEATSSIRMLQTIGNTILSTGSFILSIHSAFLPSACYSPSLQHSSQRGLILTAYAA